MTPSRIRPLALCLFRHEGRILVGSAYDTVKQDHYCRPLGGGIEFGERGAEAVVREIREELGAEIEDVRWLGTLENLFTCEGEPGHEIVLIYDAVFTDGSLYDRAFLHGYEQDAAVEAFTAEWKTLDELTSESVRLVPEGLMAFLAEACGVGSAGAMNRAPRGVRTSCPNSPRRCSLRPPPRTAGACRSGRG